MTPYEIAKTMIGTKEIPGSDHNKDIVEFHSTTTLKATDDETSWCSSFVNWCVTKAGLKGTNSAAARSWLDWGLSIEEPLEGDIVIFKRPPNPKSGHVAFFVKREGDLIYALGGNQSDQVKISKYKAEDLLGYRRAA